MAATLTANVSVRPNVVVRGAVAVLTGFLAVALMSLATDQVLHWLQVYPPWGQPMHEPGLNALALSYRLVYTLFGGYITARLAPRSPMRHVAVLGVIGLIAASAGAVVVLTVADLGPAWYPVALAVTAFPCTWLGGRLYRANGDGRTDK